MKLALNALFSNKPYKGQIRPLLTYSTNAKGAPSTSRMQRIDKKIQGIVRNIGEGVAIEIGPGTASVLHRHNFGKKIYIDSSPAIAKMLKKKGYSDGESSIAVLADIRKLPISAGRRADIIVANEVLTQIWPHERQGAVKEIAERANAILIIDRPRIPFDKFLEEVKEKVKNRLKVAGGEISAEAAKEWENPERIEGLARVLYAQRVDFEKITGSLEKSGWEVGEETETVHGERYVILTAKRKEL
ncbi:class I SAM-dependent methyltransferase [Candidatus Micrarchaeota archaeon]|nr:class I SAM-dependent methyltransferase [Candidatus Micrarchaeota archaeon]